MTPAICSVPPWIIGLALALAIVETGLLIGGLAVGLWIAKADGRRSGHQATAVSS